MISGEGNPLVAARVDSTGGVDGLWLVESLREVGESIGSGGWVDPAVAVGGAGLESLGLVLDPVGSLVSMGVAWLMEQVRPLSEALDWLAGDPDQVAAHAQTWVNIAAQAAAGGEELAAAVGRDVAGWTGQAAEAYRVHVGEQVAALSGIGQAAAGIAQATEGAGRLVAAVRMVVRDLIAECVAVLAARLPQWLAVTGATVGIASPWVISQVSSLVAEWVARINRFLSGLVTSLGNLSPLLARLADLLAQQRLALEGLARHDPTIARMTDAGSGPPTPSWRESVGRGSDVAEASNDVIPDVARKIGDPQSFDPHSLKGMGQEEVAALIPDDWEQRPSKSGEGTIYVDPHNAGRQIRVMPGYPENRPDPVTHGPYAVVSQGGTKTKVPLDGNPILGGE